MRCNVLAGIGFAGCAVQAQDPPGVVMEWCPDADEAAAPPTAIQVGTDREPFAPVSDDAPLGLVVGPQGLTMLAYRLELEGSAPTCAWLEAAVTGTGLAGCDGEQVDRVAFESGRSDELFFIFGCGAPPEALAGTPIVLRISLGEDGSLGTRTLDVVPREAP